MDQPIFQPYPSELVFQNFAPTQTYSLQLNLFNNDRVCEEATDKDDRELMSSCEERATSARPSSFSEMNRRFTNCGKFLVQKVSRKVRLDLQDSDFFQVTGLKNDGCKVAPGMSAAFYVCFTPQENKVLG